MSNPAGAVSDDAGVSEYGELRGLVSVNHFRIQRTPKAPWTFIGGGRVLGDGEAEREMIEVRNLLRLPIGQPLGGPCLPVPGRFRNGPLSLALVGLDGLDAAGANVGPLLVLGVADGSGCAVCPVGRGIPHLDGAAHPVRDPLGVLACAAFGVVAYQDGLTEGDVIGYG